MFDIATSEHNQEGIIILKRPLDYETKKAYTFKVDASNAHLDPRFQSFGAFKDTATVKINVLDVDEPPVFNKHSYVMDVYEDTPAGTIIGAVTAQDLDAGSSPVRYSIDWKSDLDSYFDIDPVEGTISTNELLDRESIAQHNISIVATKLNSPVLTSRVAVTVHVLDINEFPPELASPYETFVCENAKMGQVFQTFSAKDQDLPTSGQQFSFKSPKEDIKNNKNFTIRDFGNNTAGIVTKRSGFRRRLQEIYFLPVVIEDNGYPPKSSTGTLTIRVCGCESDGSLLTCSAEAIFLPVGLSTGALIAILLCIIILLVIVVLYVGLRRQKKKETLMSSKEDIRDNVIHYDDEGGGEEDTHAFDMGTLRNPKVIKENLYRRDVKPEMKRDPRPPVSQDSADIRDFINQRLKEHDIDNSAPPYDSLATYAYEGDGSVAESLSSIQSLTIDLEEDYDYLNDWGPRFKTLAGIFGEQSETQSDSTTTENTH
ncbi:cadherin-12-like isoform X4 [Xiphias gladius]|nr:cadherin-12-like isoform X4 [Xiphias gladius]